MKLHTRWLFAGILTLIATLPLPAATVWVSTTGADNRCSTSTTTGCPTANFACGRCSNNASVICSGNNVACGGGATTCVADAALGACSGNLCGTSTSLACKTIERGAVRANSGDTVRVLAGTYHECVGAQPILNIAIVADAFETSQNRAATVIDGTGICDGTGAVFRPAVFLSDGAALRGFTVRGGGSAGVKGIGSVTITKNIITGNRGDVVGYGGGIYAYSTYIYPNPTAAVLRVEDNDVLSNSAPNGGGGIYILSRSRTGRVRNVNISGNIVRNNTTTEGRATGAGIFVRTLGMPGGSMTVAVTQNTIEGNSNLGTSNPDTTYGGGIAAFSYDLGTHNVNITGNTIKTNVSGGLGGGIAMITQGGPLSVLNLTASGNTVEGNGSVTSLGDEGFGGGIWCDTIGVGTETIAITGNTIRANTALLDGGGIAAWSYPAPTTTGSHHVSVASNTVTENQAANGGGIQIVLVGAELPATAVAEVSATDNLITNNTASAGVGQAGGLYAIHESNRTAAPGLRLSAERNTITGNTSGIVGGGALIWAHANAERVPAPDGTQEPTTAEVRFAHNVVMGNHAIEPVERLATGGGVFAFLQAIGTATATLNLDFETIAGNDADAGAGGVEIESETTQDISATDEGAAILRVSNSVLSDNFGFGIGGVEPGEAGALTAGGTGNLDVTEFEFNDVFGNDPGGNYETWFGTRTGLLGNVSFDPQLNDAGVPVAAGGLPVQCSGAVDRADPTASFAAEPSPNGRRANAGHLGGTAGATPSLADVNLDSAVDGVDVLRIATSFASSTGQPRFLAAADIDGDGQIDGVDLNFVAIQFGTSCR